MEHYIRTTTLHDEFKAWHEEHGVKFLSDEAYEIADYILFRITNRCSIHAVNSETISKMIDEIKYNDEFCEDGVLVNETAIKCLKIIEKHTGFPVTLKER